MRPRRAAVEIIGIVGAGLASIWALDAAASAVADAGHPGGAAFAAGVAVLLLGGAATGLVMHPKLGHCVLLAAVATLVFWANYHPSGEAAPSERGMDWRARTGYALLACLVTALWSIAALAASYFRDDTGRAQHRA